MRSTVTLYDDQYQFFKELKSEKLLVAFVEFMFDDVEPKNLNKLEKIVFNSLRVRMENQKKKSYAWTQSHGWWRGSNTSSDLDHENNTPNNTKTTEQTTEKQQVKEKEKENKKRKGYGEFKKCLLSDDEYNKVISEYWLRNWEKLINDVDNYCASKWRTYKNYLAAIRKFAEKAWINKLSPKQEMNETWIYDLPF